MAIKDWKKVGNTEWVKKGGSLHEAGPRQILIDRAHGSNQLYVVFKSREYLSSGEALFKGTKPKAVLFARAYMRSH